MFHNKSRTRTSKKQSKKKTAAKPRAARIRVINQAEKAKPAARTYDTAAAPAVVALVADSIQRLAMGQMPGRDNWRRIYRYNKALRKETGMSANTICRARRILVRQQPDTYRQVGHSLYVKCDTRGKSGG